MAMLYSSEREIKLQTTYSRASYISVAFDNTIAIVYIRNKVTYFAHFSKEGKLLFQKDIDSLSGSFGMMSDLQFTFISPKINSITTIHLKDYSFHNIFHDISNSKQYEAFLQYFYESQLICVVQLKNPKEHRLKLTYYHHSDQQHAKPLAAYDSEQKDWKFENAIKKGNNHSLIIWFQGIQSKYFQFRTFELTNNNQGTLKHYKIKRDIETYPLQISVSDAWQASDNSIIALISCNSLKFSSLITSFLVADREKSNIQENNPKLENVIMAASAYCGSFSIFTTYKRSHAQFQYIPVLIYFDNQTKKVLMEANTLYFNYKTYHRQQMSYYKINYLQFQKLSLKIVRIMRPKEIALHFMLHLNEDFDDDLLQDAISLLDLLSE